jgi:hypothetical protein
MSLVTLALVNGTLAVAMLAGLAYVCSLPFRLEADPPADRMAAVSVYEYEDLAA